MRAHDPAPSRKTIEQIVLISGLILAAALVAVGSQLFGMYRCVGESDMTCTELSWVRGGMVVVYVAAVIFAAGLLTRTLLKKK